MLFETLTEAYVSVRQVEHEIKWWAIITAISVFKILMTYQSSNAFINSTIFTRRLAQLFGYGAISILLLIQFWPYIQAFYFVIFKFIDSVL
jgi:hypothetical protein